MSLHTVVVVVVLKRAPLVVTIHGPATATIIILDTPGVYTLTRAIGVMTNVCIQVK